MSRSRKVQSSPSSPADATLNSLLMILTAARLSEAGAAAADLFSDHSVKLLTADDASLVSLIVDDRKVATFGPGDPLECVDALYGFVTHLVTRNHAEA